MNINFVKDKEILNIYSFKSGIVGNMMQSVVLDGNPLNEDDGNLLNEVVLDA